MPPPVAVYVVAAVVGVAAIFAFKEFVYEPHIAPRFEAWAEDFLERRRAARNHRASAVSVRASRQRHSSNSSAHSSHNEDAAQRDQAEGDGVLDLNGFTMDDFELEALASKEVDEWRNEVLRSQERTRDTLRRRKTNRLTDVFDSFDSTSTTLDESFTSLTHTPLASTHVISNISSPFTLSTASLPPTPNDRTRSGSQATTTQGEVDTISHSPQSPNFEMPVMSLADSPVSVLPTRRLSADDQADMASPSPLAIPVPIKRSSTAEGVVPHPLPFTPTYQVVSDDSPFGPLLPDTPRSSAEMYGKRPFSPITRVMESSGAYTSAAGSQASLSSNRSESSNSIRTLGGSGMLRKRSGLMNEVVMNDSEDDTGDENHPFASTATSVTFTQTSSGHEVNESIISSLSERYPAPPTPPVIISPPSSSVGLVSLPSSPRSGTSEIMVPDNASPRPYLPLLQVPSDSHNGRHSTTPSPALSFASFLSPMAVSRATSESEGDEFMSVASDDESDWHASSPVVPSVQGVPVHDRPNNPFLDFEHGGDDGRSEGSEVLVGPGDHLSIGQPEEGAPSEAGSDVSWGSARRHG